MIDTRPAVVIPVAVTCGALVAGAALLAIHLAANGPDYPALYNNSDVPATVTVNGAPHAPVQPGDTLRVRSGTVWVVPAELSCNWHPGQAGGPREITAGSLPVTGYTTIEVCLPR